MDNNFREGLKDGSARGNDMGARFGHVPVLPILEGRMTVSVDFNGGWGTEFEREKKGKMRKRSAVDLHLRH